MHQYSKLFVVAHGKSRQRAVSIVDEAGATICQLPSLDVVMARKAIDGKLDTSLPIAKLVERAWQEQYDTATRLVQCWNSCLNIPTPTLGIQVAESPTRQPAAFNYPRMY